jgi:hypothetical protein
MSLSQNFPTIPPSLLLDFANVKALDPRVTFTRASAARYYDGVTTAKAEENLLRASQDFNISAGTFWFLAGSGVTAVLDNAVAPDGTTTADTITTTAANTGVRQSIEFTNGVTYSISVYVRSVSGATGFTADLQNSQTSPSLTLTGSWQRFTYTVTASATRTWLDFQLDGAGSFELWGAQVEARSSVTAYTPTTTQPITNYIPVLLAAQAGVPRFDHNPTTGVSLGLLIEEQRTNLLERSEEFNNAYWSTFQATVTANQAIAPDGTLSADLIAKNTGPSANYSVFRGSLGGSGAYTLSVYAKTAGSTVCKLFIGTSFAEFNLSAGTTATSGASMVSVGNGWYRCIYTLTATASFLIEIGGTDVGGKGIYIWGAQLEAGAFPTSYIPTVASQVTRSADAASMTGTNFSSWYRADEGSIVAGFGVNQVPSLDARLFYIGDGTTSNLMESNLTTATNVVRFNVSTGGASQAAIITSATAAQGTQNWAVATYKVNDFAATANGAAAVTDTVGTVPVPNQLVIGNYAGLSRYINGTIRKIAYYPKRLANAELQALTQN